MIPVPPVAVISTEPLSVPGQVTLFTLIVASNCVVGSVIVIGAVDRDFYKGLKCNRSVLALMKISLKLQILN